MEKTPMYAVVTPSRPHKPRWLPWVSAVVSVIAVIVAGVTAYMAKRQMNRVSVLEESVLHLSSLEDNVLQWSALEETVQQMQIDMEQILQLTHEYLEYEEEVEDPQGGGVYEELTVRGVVRKKRQASQDDDDDHDGREDGVPIYDQAYGVNLNNRFNSEGLRLYESFVGNNGEGDPRSDQVSFEATESPIKPHHRPIASRENDANFEEDAIADVVTSRQTRRRSQLVERRSRVKSLHGAGKGIRRRQKSRDHSKQNPINVLYRESFVKATSPNGGFSRAGLNTVVPQTPTHPRHAPTVVEQSPRLRTSIPDALVSASLKKKKPRKKQRRRLGHKRARSPITLAHFVAAPANRTASHHANQGEIHDEWTPAAWMDKLGLNRKYTMRRGSVTVKESGLYYLYAQVLYETGRFGTGFQLMVDGIPVMECTLTPSQPSHSCHTSGTTYLQRNAAVYIRDIESHMNPVRREANSFFGLIKLMDAPDTAERLLLG